MGKGVLPNGPAVPSLENNFHGPALKRINARGRTVGTAAGASQYEPPVAARAPTLFMQVPLAFLRFRRRGKWRDPFYGKRGPAITGRPVGTGAGTDHHPLDKNLEFLVDLRGGPKEKPIKNAPSYHKSD